MTIDEAVQYFLHSQNSPYTLLYLAVSKLLTERLGSGVFDAQDALFVCHMSAQSFDKAHSSRSVSLSTRADMLRSAALRRRLTTCSGDRAVRDVAALPTKDHGTKETEAAQDSDQVVAV